MQSTHKIYFENAHNMKALADESVDLVVTSPPYPMIEMWDEIFIRQDKRIRQALNRQDGPLAFESMHGQLDRVWDEVFRVLKRGGIACINIGDAVRTINGRFSLYTNHSRILTHLQKIGFSTLPAILWRKQTNAPNKFMGSGMMPAGAYVTLEHEYILILRKGGKREFLTEAEKRLRRESAFFWEERNTWFSDVWMDLKGTTQKLFEHNTRDRSAAFPFELPYRLVNMFSLKGDMVLDPFLGLGTTMFAAMAANRNSIGYEIDSGLTDLILSKLTGIVSLSNTRIIERLSGHCDFIEDRYADKGGFKHSNKYYGFPVMTGQETELIINELKEAKQTGRNSIEVVYSDRPQSDYTGFGEVYLLSKSEQRGFKKPGIRKKAIHKNRQQQLFR